MALLNSNPQKGRHRKQSKLAEVMGTLALMRDARSSDPTVSAAAQAILLQKKIDREVLDAVQAAENNDPRRANLVALGAMATETDLRRQQRKILGSAIKIPSSGSILGSSKADPTLERSER